MSQHQMPMRIETGPVNSGCTVTPKAAFRTDVQFVPGFKQTPLPNFSVPDNDRDKRKESGQLQFHAAASEANLRTE
jgi:hypothetical protein